MHKNGVFYLPNGSTCAPIRRPQVPTYRKLACRLSFPCPVESPIQLIQPRQDVRVRGNVAH
jgi:hypothetical protein